MNRHLVWFAQALGVLSAFLAVYVGYSHVASILTASEYDGRPVDEQFDSLASLTSRWEVRTRGDIHYDVENGRLHVSAPATTAGEFPRLDLVGPVRRLGELRARFRVKKPLQGAVDIGIGVETAESNAQTLQAMASHSGELTSYRLWGHVDSLNRRSEAAIELARAPQSTESPSDVSTIELRLSPSTLQALLLVDGVPQTSRWSDWPAGTAVRFVAHVAARERGQPIDVELTELQFEPLVHDTREFDFVDHLNGKFIDPRRWWIERGAPELALVTFGPSPEGLHTTAHARAVNRPEAITALRTPIMSLGAFDASMDVSIKELTRGAVFLSMSNMLFGASSRKFVVGVLGGDDGLKHGFALGNWTADNQVTFRLLAPVKDDRARVRMHYDASTRRAKACIDDHCDLDEKLDLEPTEQVTFSLVTELNAPNGAFDLLVREVAFDRLGKAWR